MFVPPYNDLLGALNRSMTGLAEKSGAGTLNVPAEIFLDILRLAIKSVIFNEDGYLRYNPDVKEALKRGEIASAHQHFIDHGYFEGRIGFTPPVQDAVQDAWYRWTNPDVDEAIRSGILPSAEHHYVYIGSAEFRAPNPAVSVDVEKWKKLLHKKGAEPAAAHGSDAPELVSSNHPQRGARVRRK